MKTKFFLFFILVLLLVSCSKVVIKPVNYAWMLEDKLVANEKGLVRGAPNRNLPIFNIKNILQLEQQDTTATEIAGKEVRIIRDKEGYYFITANMFKNIYIFKSAKASMELYNTIFISAEGLQNPRFNQRSSHIQLLHGEEVTNLTSEGVKQEK